MPGLFTNAYSGIITKGLGLPACNGMITMHFSLFAIEIIPPPTPPGGAGGGPYPFRGAWNQTIRTTGPQFYTPAGRFSPQETRYVTVTMKIKGKEYKRFYVIDKEKADIIVKVHGLFKTAKDKIRVVVSNIKSLFQRKR